jgi:hypothetical protein
MPTKILTVQNSRGTLPSRVRGQNNEPDKVMINNSEEIRLRYLYRKLILEGKVVLSFEFAKKLIGPDCAFHLYSNIDSKTTKRNR